jgi:hypothetical protein
MSVRYLSYDIQKGGDYAGLRGFVKKHKGEVLSSSLYRFDTDLSLDEFRTELSEAIDGDESVFLIVRTKEGIAHGRPGRRAKKAKR